MYGNFDVLTVFTDIHIYNVIATTLSALYGGSTRWICTFRAFSLHMWLKSSSRSKILFICSGNCNTISRWKNSNYACNKASNKWCCIDGVDVLTDSLFHHFTSSYWQTQRPCVHYHCSKAIIMRYGSWEFYGWADGWMKLHHLKGWLKQPLLVRPGYSPIMWKDSLSYMTWLYGWNKDLIHWFSIWI